MHTVFIQTLFYTDIVLIQTLELGFHGFLQVFVLSLPGFPIIDSSFESQIRAQSYILFKKIT